MKRKIGVFDSGVGGLSVASAIKKASPAYEVVFKNDSEHVPYGSRSIEEIYKLCLPIIKSLETDGCEVIVIACNTVTTNLIERLRKDIGVPLVGMEPMVKTAVAKTKTKVVTVCATPRTLASKRYEFLKSELAGGVKVLEPNCSDWTEMIETNQIDKDKIEQIVASSLAQKSDVIVLGCTHYHWIEDLIKSATNGQALVLQPEEPVIRQLKLVLEKISS